MAASHNKRHISYPLFGVHSSTDNDDKSSWELMGIGYETAAFHWSLVLINAH